MPGQILMFPRRDADLTHCRDEKLSRRVEVSVAALRVPVGQEVALLGLGPLAGILERLQPCLAGDGQVEANHLSGMQSPALSGRLVRPDEPAVRLARQVCTERAGYVQRQRLNCFLAILRATRL